MRHHIKDAVEIFFCLFLYRFYDLRPGIADIQHADPSYKIQEFISVHILQHRAFSSAYTDGIGGCA